MSLTFYYSPMSTATLTSLVIEELALPCEKVKVNIQTGDNQKPEFLALNPNGKVPVVVHDGTVLWESCAITMYLGETFGVEKGLYPAPGAQRGEAMKWITWSNVTVGDAVGRWARNTQAFIPAEQHNAKAAEAAKKDMDKCLQILDDTLAKRPFLTGSYSLADTHVNSIVDWMRFMKIDFARFGHINAWSKKCSERPAYAKVMGAEMS